MPLIVGQVCVVSFIKKDRLNRIRVESARVRGLLLLLLLMMLLIPDTGGRNYLSP